MHCSVQFSTYVIYITLKVESSVHELVDELSLSRGATKISGQELVVAVSGSASSKTGMPTLKKSLLLSETSCNCTGRTTSLPAPRPRCSSRFSSCANAGGTRPHGRPASCRVLVQETQQQQLPQSLERWRQRWRAACCRGTGQVEIFRESSGGKDKGRSFFGREKVQTGNGPKDT